MLKNEPINMNSKRSIKLIVDTMLVLLKDKNFSKITISELTKKAGVVRNTFYAHFECKEDVLMYYMYELFRERTQSTSMHGDIEHIDFVELYFNIWADNIDFLCMLTDNQLLHLLSRFGDQFDLLWSEFDVFDAYKDSEKTDEYVDALCADSLASIVKSWLKTGQKETPLELSEIFNNFVHN